MATTKITISDSEWVLVLSGAGVIQLRGHGHIHLHVGITIPDINTESYHTFTFSPSTDYEYLGTEKVYCKNGCSGDVDIVYTEIA